MTSPEIRRELIRSWFDVGKLGVLHPIAWTLYEGKHRAETLIEHGPTKRILFRDDENAKRDIEVNKKTKEDLELLRDETMSFVKNGQYAQAIIHMIVEPVKDTIGEEIVEPIAEKIVKKVKE